MKDKKKISENIAKALPSFFKNVTDYLKVFFSAENAKTLESANGTIGVLINLFAQPIIDNYFEKQTQKKLADFGLPTYLKAAFLQAKYSLEKIKDHIHTNHSSDIIFGIIQNSIKKEITTLEQKEIILVFQPKYHPAITSIKENYNRILSELGINHSQIDLFSKDFNDGIESTLKNEFGDDYDKHLEEISNYLMKESEVDLLIDTINDSKIGFKEGEDLDYLTTFSKWQEVANIRNITSEVIEDQFNDEEEENDVLQDIRVLINNYFSKNPENNLEDILFIIADFGKGKSVFMKQYASELAKQYLAQGEGYIPIYFNLRNYKKYSPDHKLGIIGDYLEEKYSIKIDDDYFKNKKYVFLVDSLDESGELNKGAIDRVIYSVKRIQSIDKTKYKTNRIIITSRPFDDGLAPHLNDHNPYVINNNDNRPINCYLNLHGFTKEQFNIWLSSSLKKSLAIDKTKSFTLGGKSIDSQTVEEMDFYNQLFSSNTLSESELRRPIFAYMIYQLVANNIDFSNVGKIGVYLSFLNLLTKEAKHIHDINYNVNLKEEFEYRNILHSTAALWMQERQKGNQGALSKAKICRVLEGKLTSESDNEILERFKNQGITEISFLSHSYFGENNNLIHFHHQSFAEILLAEYYLKVLLKYALDDEDNNSINEARIKLVLGEPTKQTVLFFDELLTLLKDSSISGNSPEIIEKRRLLFPLLASLATKKNNRLFCNRIYYSWFKDISFEENQTTIPSSALEKWCIDHETISKILRLSANILNAKNQFLPIQANEKSALYKYDVSEVQNQTISFPKQNIDRWLVLLTGNRLYNDLTKIEQPTLFNWDYEINFEHLFELVNSWNYSYKRPAPFWGLWLFQGINMESNLNSLNLSHMDFDGLNFSHSFFKNIHSWSSNWSRCIIDHCSFNNVDWVTSLFFGTSLQHIKKVEGSFYIANCQTNLSGFSLMESILLLDIEDDMGDFTRKSYIPNQMADEFSPYYKTISGILIYALENKRITINKIKRSLIFESDSMKKEFFKFLDDQNKIALAKRKIGRKIK